VKYSFITPRHWCLFFGLPNTVETSLKQTHQNSKASVH